MCGIAGQLAFPSADIEAVKRCVSALGHRGPDGSGTYHDGAIALGHTRLSIIDVAGGAQPQFNEDRSIAVVFNGEIYNYRELMADLESRHIFKTRSDTEVLVHLYEEHGHHMLGHLRGMFAFAIWDAHKQVIFAARDRFGEKPFYYADSAGRFTFASELGALGASGIDLGSVDRAALAAYLEVLYVPAPRTIRTGVNKLPAGHFLLAGRKGVEVKRYWHPPVPGSARGPAIEPGDVLSALKDSIQLTLRSDVPIGALLSGGVDSSVVVGLLASQLGPGVKTYCVGFGQRDDELPFARMVARQHQTDHHELIVGDHASSASVETFAAFGEPFGDSSAVPTMAVFREVRKHVKVVLTGDGGDELFAGYDRYRSIERLPHLPTSRAASMLERLPNVGPLSSLARRFRVLGSRGAERVRATIQVFSRRQRQRLLGDDTSSAVCYPHARGDGNAAIAFDLATYLPDDLLFKTDTAAMHWGVEARCPLLDSHLAEALIPRPLCEKQDANTGKLALKRAVAEFVPPAILARSKRGFGSPVAHWLNGPLKPLFLDLVGARNARVRNFFDGSAVDALVSGLTRVGSNPHQAWAMLALEAWARNNPS